MCLDSQLRGIARLLQIVLDICQLCSLSHLPERSSAFKQQVSLRDVIFATRHREPPSINSSTAVAYNRQNGGFYAQSSSRFE